LTNSPLLRSQPCSSNAAAQGISQRKEFFVLMNKMLSSTHGCHKNNFTSIVEVL
jgi:hypothetical protein